MLDTEVIVDEREDMLEDLAEAEADEQWWTEQDADEEFAQSWASEYVERWDEVSDY